MTYSLTRDRDGAGDRGPISVVLNGERNLSKPTVGYSLRVGSINHWWTTTEVFEILVDDVLESDRGKIHVVEFKTVNGSTYSWIKHL